MKKQTMYNRLQKQYEKLNQSIQKAMKTGRFYAYTQFKQEQLLSRLKRCSFQLKQIGAGVAVVAALGMATPAVGQSYNLVQRTGIDNPVDLATNVESSTFVDIDGDGDLDLFTTRYSGGAVIMQYFKNEGTATTPDFVLQTAANNPLNSFSTVMHDLAFVDIDGDGDLDVFATNYYYVGTSFDYYKNDGTVTNPIFISQTGAANPLDSVSTHLNVISSSVGQNVSGHPSFVDIDNDGDMDCFIGVQPYYGWTASADVADKLWYYENIGTMPNAPVFQRTNNTDNPLGQIMANPLIGNRAIEWGIQFFDGDTDGDQDGIINLGDKYFYLKNEGTDSFPNIGIATGITPLDAIVSSSSLSPRHISYVDLDGDSDFDVVLTPSNATTFEYYQNITPVGIKELNQSAETIGLYPNPTNGNITLERAVTGQLSVFNVTGQTVYSKEVEAIQSINLSFLEAGTYLLSIEENNKLFQQTIVLQK
jgi:hypothetical protein